MAEYVKGVGRIEEDSLAQPKAESSYMGVDDMDEAPSQPAAELKQEAPGAGKFGAWVSAEGDGADDAEDADMAEAKEEEKDEDDALIHEKAIGKGEYTLIVISSICCLFCSRMSQMLCYHLIWMLQLSMRSATLDV